MLGVYVLFSEIVYRGAVVVGFSLTTLHNSTFDEKTVLLTVRFTG